jgi:hypothetical protein
MTIDDHNPGTLQERLAAPPGRRLMLQELLRIFFAEAVRG